MLIYNETSILESICGSESWLDWCSPNTWAEFFWGSILSPPRSVCRLHLHCLRMGSTEGVGNTGQTLCLLSALLTAPACSPAWSVGAHGLGTRRSKTGPEHSTRTGRFHSLPAPLSLGELQLLLLFKWLPSCSSSSCHLSAHL